jgi:hypothetical protein
MTVSFFDRETQFAADGRELRRLLDFEPAWPREGHLHIENDR